MAQNKSSPKVHTVYVLYADMISAEEMKGIATRPEWFNDVKNLNHVLNLRRRRFEEGSLLDNGYIRHEGQGDDFLFKITNFAKGPCKGMPEVYVDSTDIETSGASGSLQSGQIVQINYTDKKDQRHAVRHCLVMQRLPKDRVRVATNVRRSRMTADPQHLDGSHVIDVPINCVTLMPRDWRSHQDSEPEPEEEKSEPAGETQLQNAVSMHQEDPQVDMPPSVMDLNIAHQGTADTKQSGSSNSVPQPEPAGDQELDPTDAHSNDIWESIDLSKIGEDTFVSDSALNLARPSDANQTLDPESRSAGSERVVQWGPVHENQAISEPTSTGQPHSKRSVHLDISDSKSNPSASESAIRVPKRKQSPVSYECHFSGVCRMILNAAVQYYGIKKSKQNEDPSTL